MEMGEFRSKWVGDTERQQARILLAIRALGPVIVVVDEADAVFGDREADGDSGVSGRVFAAFAAHIGDSTLRGRELWVAMTSRPDLLSIDMKRQGRFGLCIPLFPAQGPDDVLELFTTVAQVKKIALAQPTLAYIRENLGARPLTGSDVESILIRAKEQAVLAKRDDDVQRADLEEAVNPSLTRLNWSRSAVSALITPSLLATAAGQGTRSSKPSPAPLGFSLTTRPIRGYVRECGGADMRSRFPRLHAGSVKGAVGIGQGKAARWGERITNTRRFYRCARGDQKRYVDAV